MHSCFQVHGGVNSLSKCIVSEGEADTIAVNVSLYGYTGSCVCLGDDLLLGEILL